ncbi:type I methionyl aminopeptidase [Flavisolibacter ginsenosidimutans]|uniref:Methionine aminopeptidase n=1 Tax=Flavisolibacter ginsenosidimutans TaxID=661481 RepID=A0A5B8UI53_9BACT|nr:type I methionyl aminopeptidase [Flavisolibacter ginsenosidimutans]QEC56203.1 type I methionyl aminopeptidase [Flavisolibacter ginsenosidimutans]
MIHYKTEAEIAIMRQSALLVSSTLAEVAKILKPGLQTIAIDGFIGTVIKDHGGIPSFLNFHGYPFNSCISVNDVVVHGFPNKTELKEGDIVSIDIGIYKNGYHGDHAYTFMIGKPGNEVVKLVKITKESLYKGIEKAVAGNRIGDIAFAIQEHTEKKNGYGVVRELVGHGLGKSMHEDPQVPNYGKRGSGPVMKEGLVIAIEPMINMGKKEVYTEDDGWTVRTKDGKPSVHFEHDVCVRKGKADVLSNYAEIEKAEKENGNLFADY